MSVAFIKEESAETASETLLPDRPVSPHPNLVTETGLKALELHLQQAREAFDATSTIEDVNERRRQSAGPLRELRYFAERVRTAQLVPDPASFDVVAFGSTVTFSRDDGGCRNTGSSERMKPIQRPGRSPTCPRWQGFSWANLSGTSRVSAIRSSKS